ncbi:MAG: metallophosphoesterase [Candidatus Methanoperedenaceae archaeon]|nr:metallophosphoesterase [Candidatus Methanoperedenaceae archaeon]
MKIGIISDTHDNQSAIDEAVRVFNREEVELVIHAGDWNAPFSMVRLARAKARIVGVFGNVDGERDFMKEKAEEAGVEILGDSGELEEGGIKIALYHGNQEMFVDALSRSGMYNVVARGHTHNPELKNTGSCLVINPGEGCGYLTGKRTLVILDTASMAADIVDF